MAEPPFPSSMQSTLRMSLLSALQQWKTSRQSRHSSQAHPAHGTADAGTFNASLSHVHTCSMLAMPAPCPCLHGQHCGVLCALLCQLVLLHPG